MSDSENDDLSDDVYVINRIAGLKEHQHQRYFLIEWEGYHITENTWEEEDDVYSENAILQFYSDYEELKNIDIRNIKKTNGRWLLNDTYDPATKKFSPTTLHSSLAIYRDGPITRGVQKRFAEEFLEHNSIKMMKENHLILDKSGSVLSKSNTAANSSLDLLQSRKINTESTMEIHPIEQYIDETKSYVPMYRFKGLDCPVTIVNDFDVDSDEIVLPDDFLYISDLVYTSPVKKPNPEFLTACFCHETSSCTEACHEDSYAYDDNGLLALSSRSAVYECTSACLCHDHCKNRVVQRGRTIPLEVFKTAKKGWGVRSKQPISRGMFIEQYIGEVLTMEEADHRADSNCHYLFEMDFARDEYPTKYVIDAYQMGNVSRLFNHSCSPNMEVIAVNYDSVEVEMHRLAFFANRDIAMNEELCFDYNGYVDSEHEIPNRYYSRCKCGASNCRGSIFI